MKPLVKISICPPGADLSRYFSKRIEAIYDFVINDESCDECDYWVVYENLPFRREWARVNPRNVFLITGEVGGPYSRSFLGQFARVVTNDLFLKSDRAVYSATGRPWFIHKTYDELMACEDVGKSRLCSIVVSDKADISYAKNYKIRRDFADFLKKRFAGVIDFYGRNTRPVELKDDALFPYKYSIALENTPTYSDFSEKLADCWLTHTFPFYFDCPNIERMFPDRPLLRLDLTDFAYSAGIIEKTLADEGFYEENLPKLVRAKREYLTKYSFVSVILNVIRDFGDPRPGDRSGVGLRRNKYYLNRIKYRSVEYILNKF